MIRRDRYARPRAAGRRPRRSEATRARHPRDVGVWRGLRGSTLTNLPGIALGPAYASPGKVAEKLFGCPFRAREWRQPLQIELSNKHKGVGVREGASSTNDVSLSKLAPLFTASAHCRCSQRRPVEKEGCLGI